jgi:hypothetical protein
MCASESEIAANIVSPAERREGNTTRIYLSALFL